MTEVAVSSDRFFTLAVWSVFDMRWMPLVTTSRGEVAASLARQFQALVFWPHALIELTGGSDDEVEAAVSALAPPPDFNWESVMSDLRWSVDVANVHDVVHPRGDPNR